MLKKVTVTLTTARTQLDGSLFEGIALAHRDGATTEKSTVTLQGRYYDNGTRVAISYKESAESGLEGTESELSFSKEDPREITLRRTGAVKSMLSFRAGERFCGVYQTPIMPFDVCVQTALVENNLQGVGTLRLVYTVEIKGAEPERTELLLTLK